MLITILYDLLQKIKMYLIFGKHPYMKRNVEDNPYNHSANEGVFGCSDLHL